MIHCKSPQEMNKMREGGKILHEVMEDLRLRIKPGITTLDIDEAAEELLIKKKATSSFKTVEGYHWTICSPVNEQIVHTVPSKRVLKSGDVLTIDIGALYKGFHTDYADTWVVGGKADKKILAFLQTGSYALKEAISVARCGNRVGHISEKIEAIVTSNNYSIVHELTGHGIGRKLHEDPFVPGFVDRPVHQTPLLKAGMAIAIEVIYTLGSGEMKYNDFDKWTIETADKSISACFEHTVLIKEGKAEILT